jgi:hypothetical protein
VRPYYGSAPDSQVNGIVTGINGGAVYEVMVGRANLGRTYWDAFAVSLMIAVCTILVGGIVSIAQMVISRRRGEPMGEDK